MTVQQPVLTADSRVVLSVLLCVANSADERMIRVMLRRWGYDVVSVIDCDAAMAQMQRRSFSIVMIDEQAFYCETAAQNLPKLDFATRPHLILVSPPDGHIVSSEVLNQGIDDFLISPVNAFALRARVLAGVRSMQMRLDLARKKSLLSDMSQENERLARTLAHDLRLARDIQHALTPQSARQFGEYTVEFFVKSSSEVGGDFVTCFSNRLGQIGICAIDVSGHGYSSALLGALAIGHFNEEDLNLNLAVEQRLAPYFFAVLPPKTVAQKLNKRLSFQDDTEMYLTMCYGVLDAGQNRFTFCQAGHPSPILSTEAGFVRSMGGGGLPIGLFPDPDYQENSLHLGYGDKVLVFSDGWIECTDHNGQELGVERFEAMVKKAHGLQPSEFLPHLHQAVCQFADGGLGINDDLSAVLIARQHLPRAISL